MKDIKEFGVILIAISIILIGIFIYWSNIPKTDYSCNVDSDCEIKNIGNRCGYYPACVNKNYQPHPPELDSPTCMIPSVTGCKCVENTCHDLP